MLDEKKRVADFGNPENPFIVSEAYDLKKYIVDDKEFGKDFFKLVNTGTIDKYISLWGQKTTAYIKDKYKRPLVKKEPFKKAMQKRYEQSNSNKIIITGIRYFECFLDNKCEYVAGKSTIIIRNCKTKANFNYLLSILNSKAMSFYVKQAYNVLGIDGGVNFTAPMISSLPVPNAPTGDRNRLADFVDSIVEITRKNDYFENSEERKKVEELKGSIDALVYKLFDLSSEEKKLIEKTVIQPKSRKKTK